MSSPMMDSAQMRFGLNDRPAPITMVGLGLQHVLTMFGATIAVPLILSGPMEATPEETALLISSVMLASGIATFIQVRFGTRLPLIQGVSFAFLGPFFAIIGAAGAGVEVSMPFIAGAILAGSLVQIVIGYSTLFGRIRKFISPVVIGPVIALIGLALFDAAAGEAGADWGLASLVIVLAFLFSLILAPKVRFFSLFPILLAVLTAYVVAVVLTQVGVYGPEHPSAVDFGGVADAAWFRDPTTLIFPWGLPQFTAGFVLATLAGFLAGMIESFGDYFAVGRASGAGYPDERQVNRGIGAEGIGCFISGLLGGFSSTSYTENIGLVALTRVASRVVVYAAAVILVVIGLITKFGAVVATIPGPIVGGLYCTLFGLIASIGLSNSARADLSSQRNLMIMGFILFMGLVVPFYFGGLGDEGLGLQPDWLEQIVVTLGSTGMAVAAVLGLILDNVVPGTDVERGLVEEPKITGPPGDLPGGEAPGEGSAGQG